MVIKKTQATFYIAFSIKNLWAWSFRFIHLIHIAPHIQEQTIVYSPFTLQLC